MPDPMVHPSALCETGRIGAGSAIQAFAHVGADARLGVDCQIASHARIGAGALLANRVIVDSGARIGDAVRLEDDVIVGANATVGCEPGKTRPGAGRLPTLVHQGVRIGANATVVPGVTVGAYAQLAPGSVVTRSVPDNAIVTGNPAQIVGYGSADGRQQEGRAAGRPSAQASSVRGVMLHHMREVEDMRGNLSVAELGREVPFEVKRYFLVYGVPNMEVRGEHAHLECHQFMIAVKGSIHVVADDGRQREEFVLDRPSLGLHLPPMTWGTQYGYSADAVLLVLASHHYDAADYIRDHDRFLDLVAARLPPA